MPTLEEVTRSYLTDIRDQRAKLNTSDELSYRDYLGVFLRGAAKVLGKSADFTGEAKKIAVGKPDYEVTDGLKVIGYVEAEALGADLTKLTGHAKEQNERFRVNLHNFLLTNHTDFRLFIEGKEVAQARLPEPQEHGKISVSVSVLEELMVLLERFLSETTPVAASPEQIARQLAKRARILRVAAEELLSCHDGPLHIFWNAYKKALSSDISRETFADVYAQTFTYGIFLAWFHADKHPFNREAALRAIPDAVPPIQVLLEFGGGRRLPEEIAWIVDGICADLDTADKEAARKPFKDKRDPMVHFYETFLREYDKNLRQIRGNYYTPDAVVDFIVRAVDGILVRDFGKTEGIADKSVRLLDPATGTGTFLVRTYRKVKETMEARGDGALWPDRAHSHVARHFYGFELLPTGYTLAHLKLRQLLAELGAPLSDQVRLPVYLTNTLEEGNPPQEQLPVVKELSDEVREAGRVKKEEQILVVLGNPPYFGKSANPSEYTEFVPPGVPYEKETKRGTVRLVASGKGVRVKRLTFIGRLLRDYFFVDGAPLGEKNPKWLQNDYVKFLRFAQWLIEKNGSGVVAYITDNSYLDAPTFRGMRQQLMQAFDDIYIYDLHGNSNKKERSPDGTKDENVFDIKQGVAVVLMVKRPQNKTA